MEFCDNIFFFFIYISSRGKTRSIHNVSFLLKATFYFLFFDNIAKHMYSKSIFLRCQTYGVDVDLRISDRVDLRLSDCSDLFCVQAIYVHILYHVRTRYITI